MNIFVHLLSKTINDLKIDQPVCENYEPAVGLNPGCPYDENLLLHTAINLSAVKRHAANIIEKRPLENEVKTAWLLRAVTCIDLTTLSGDDSWSNVSRLCHKASKPINASIIEKLNIKELDITTGAVCVYPARVKDAVNCLTKLGFRNKIPVAAVATGFPSGQYPLSTRLAEIVQAIQDGASEIDIVINRQLVLNANWKGLYEEVYLMKRTCGKTHMKSILAVGELGSLENVYKASLVCMMAGADFIKTSTGKEAVNATIPVGVVMLRAIRTYFLHTNYMVGFKPAGGVRTAKDALNWLVLIKEELGDPWLNNKYFRIGASQLLSEIEKNLFSQTFKRPAYAYELSMG